MMAKFNYTPKLFLMATKQDCPFCNRMKPVFEDVMKQFSGVQGLKFGVYDVDSDDWELADKLEFEGVPGFAMLSADAQTCYDKNNDGLVDSEILVAMIVNNLAKT